MLFLKHGSPLLHTQTTMSFIIVALLKQHSCYKNALKINLPL